MNKIDLYSWVKKDPSHLLQRQAFHIIIDAITKMEIDAKFILKGGVLISIKYGSSRFTRDIDFSTPDSYTKDKETQFLKSLNKQLVNSDVDYPIACRVQSSELRPKNDQNHNWQTLKVKIGYARRNNRNEFLRLTKGKSPNIVKLDYSFNERVFFEETLLIQEDKGIQIYDFVEIIAEKYRALIQQKVRNRSRKQDIYDIYFLLGNLKPSEAEKEKILQVAIEKSKLRDLEITKTALDDEEIKKRTEREYDNLKDQIEEELPDFNHTYQLINDFYKSLPWP